MQRFGIIIAGGAGERFWPVSRISRPKHLWDVAGTGASLLEDCFKRVAKIVPAENIFLVTNREQIAAVREICPFFASKNIIAEPLGRDTLAAVATGTLAAKIAAGGNDCSVAIFPSDQLISDVPAFQKTAEEAFAVAEQTDALVTLGISPTYPATGFGYIQAGTPTNPAFPSCRDVLQFHEKPAREVAENYLREGNYFWNAGMFFWRASTLENAMKIHVPATAKLFAEMAEKIRGNAENFAETLAEFYPQFEKKSVDFAIMEAAARAGKVKVVPAKFAWDDVGTWLAAARHLPADADGNAIRGNAICVDARGNVIFDSTGTQNSHAIALFGVENLVVVRTPDATLICSKSAADSLKNLVKILPRELR